MTFMRVLRVVGEMGDGEMGVMEYGCTEEQLNHKSSAPILPYSGLEWVRFQSGDASGVASSGRSAGFSTGSPAVSFSNCWIRNSASANLD